MDTSLLNYCKQNGTAHVWAQWHPTKNGPLFPDQVTFGNKKKVWWICEKDHKGRYAVGHRTRLGSGCPVCAGRRVPVGFNDPGTIYPAIAAQWHPTLSNDLTSELVGIRSNKQI